MWWFCVNVYVRLEFLDRGIQKGKKKKQLHLSSTLTISCHVCATPACAEGAYKRKHALFCTMTFHSFIIQRKPIRISPVDITQFCRFV